MHHWKYRANTVPAWILRAVQRIITLLVVCGWIVSAQGRPVGLSAVRTVGFEPHASGGSGGAGGGGEGGGGEAGGGSNGGG